MAGHGRDHGPCHHPPRDDVVPELMAMLDVGHDRMRCDQFGALDGLTEAEIADELAQHLEDQFAELQLRVGPGRAHETLMAQLQEIDREMMRVQNRFGIPLREGDQRARYFADKHAAFPPDVDRDPEKTYVF